METAVGIFSSRSDAEQAVRALRSRGVPADHIQLLLPESASIDLPVVPTDEAEQPGMGKAVGGVVGAAVGASAGLGLGTAAASLLIPGVGAVTAIGLAAAALFGAGGAIGGAAAGGVLEEKTEQGLPKDEVYLYEDALALGRSLVFVLADKDEEVKIARRTLEETGAETLDVARERWWVGIRDAEQEHYEKDGKTFAPHEHHYRRGFETALHPDARGRRFEEIPPHVRDRYAESFREEAFRRGYERGQAHARDVWVRRPAEAVER
jgi:hypothetical protein